MLSYRYDLVVRNAHGNLIALVEIKNAKSFPVEFAASLATQTLDESGLREIPYLMALSQEIGYLWLNATSGAIDAEHVIRLDMTPVLDRYQREDRERWWTNAVLTLRMQQWLTDLSVGLRPVAGEPERTLDSFGFIEAIRGGDVSGDSRL